MFGGRPLLRRFPAAHNPPMCYENLVRGKRWTYGPRSKYVSYPPAGRQQENFQAEHPPPFDFDRTNSHHRKQIRPLGGLPPVGQPSPPCRAHDYSAREECVIHSTARGGAIERVGGAGGDKTTASSCARTPCPSLSSAHRRAAGSCARDSRLTHHPRRHVPRHRIRRREHASLSMSPVRGGGVGVRSHARSARGFGRRWQCYGHASCRHYRPVVGTAWLGSRAGV
jgi:hypothetical protein